MKRLCGDTLCVYYFPELGINYRVFVERIFKCDDRIFIRLSFEEMKPRLVEMD